MEDDQITMKGVWDPLNSEEAEFVCDFNKAEQQRFNQEASQGSNVLKQKYIAQTADRRVGMLHKEQG